VTISAISVLDMKAAVSLANTEVLPAPCAAPGAIYADFQEKCGKDKCTGSLNHDPFNLRAEELALEDVIGGRDVRRTWTEAELVRSFAGQLTPGTPDGMVELWDESVTCIQVVRAPLLRSMTVEDMKTTLAQTVVAKVVKSQAWLRHSQVMPHEFVIFAWLPFSPDGAVLAHAEALIARVRNEKDSRFTLRLRIPEDVEALFPVLFGISGSPRQKTFSEDDVSPAELLSEDDDSDDFDLGLYWDMDFG
jgi:hypothetical protein